MQVSHFGLRTIILHNKIIVSLLLCLFTLTTLSPSGIAKETSMKIFVNASDLPRKLLHSKIKLEMKSDSMSLVYPKWIPGSHGPIGPIQNIAGFSVTDKEGDTLVWKRDWSDYYRIFLYQGKHRGNIDVNLSYIASQPSTQSKGVDSYGTADIGIVNWNTVLVYPEGIAARDIMVEVSLLLPSGWKHGSALPVQNIRGDQVYFEKVTLEDLIDMPLICGANFRTIELAKTDMATYYLHVAADDENDLPSNDDSVLIPLKRLVKEGEALFGRTHFDSYHFLVSLSDIIPSTGLEHRNSSLNGIASKDWRDPKWDGKRSQYLLSHEFAHAWCGKYRRPAGMFTPDYMTSKDTDMLWVYEGLDQYLGYVLGVRCGYSDTASFIEQMAGSIGSSIMQKGRQWRPLRDTEVSASVLRGGSASWSQLRRSQDYYREGGLLWLEFDSMIRNATNGRKSLDDFCAAFFSNGDASAHAVPFTRSEIVSTLQNITEGPWDSLITVRVHNTQNEFDDEAIAKSGYILGYTDTKPKISSGREKRLKYVGLYESLGMGINNKGKVSSIVPRSPADLAGLVSGNEIIGVNGKKFSTKRLEDAVRSSGDKNAKIELLMFKAENYTTVEINYDQGLRYYKLTPIEGKSNWLDDIAQSKVTETE